MYPHISPRDALESYTYKTVLNNQEPELTVTDPDPTAPYRLSGPAPIYNNEIPNGGVGVVNPSERTTRVKTVFDTQQTRELYTAIVNRAKWFTRVLITPESQRDHIYFFSQSLCKYNTGTIATRIPGIIRGPDASHTDTQISLGTGITENTYLVPAHLLPDKYWELNTTCQQCLTRLVTALRSLTTTPSTAVQCPDCGAEPDSIQTTQTGVNIAHTPRTPTNSKTDTDTDTDTTTPPDHPQTTCGPITGTQKTEFLDTLFRITPGSTVSSPPDFPHDATTLTDETVIDWLAPIEPITDATQNTVTSVTPFITVTTPETDKPFAITQTDMHALQTVITNHESTDN